jgi:Flp pilus assembly pilin Flp
VPPRLARLLAAVVAVGLVAGALVVRGALADDEGG